MPSNKNKNKKGAYSIYVEERCRTTGSALVNGFVQYSDEWKAMSPQEKALYHDKADRLRNITTVNRSSPTTSRSSADCGVSLSSLGAGLPSVNNPWNPEVRHAVAEYIIEDRDFPTPNPNELIERSQIAIASEYSNLDIIAGRHIKIIGCVPLAVADRSSRAINRPLEIAVEEFRIALGHSRQSYHTFISPGPLPVGQQSNITNSRRNVHKIPAGSFVTTDESDKIFHESQELKTDYYSIYQELLRMTDMKNRQIPLLCGLDEIAVTSACLTWLQNKAMEQARHERKPALGSIVLATVEQFCVNFFTLMKVAVPEHLAIAQQTYKSHRYQHIVHLRCGFHQDVDSEVCATGTANDLIYLTLDILRSWYNLPRTDRYVPVERPRPASTWKS